MHPSAKRRQRRWTQRKRFLMVESLEARKLLASDWNNALDRLDVNDSGDITPLDALLVINRLNFEGSRLLTEKRAPSAPHVDVNGDGLQAPIDALIVINHINAFGSGVRLLRDQTNTLATTQSITIGTAPAAGSRKIRFELQVSIPSPSTGIGTGLSDEFSVRIVNPDRNNEVLVNSGLPLSPIFQWRDGLATVAPGIATWDGRFLTLDTTSLKDSVSARLDFQLLNFDGLVGSSIRLQPFELLDDANGLGAPLFDQEIAFASPGPAVDTSSFVPSTSLIVEHENFVANTSTNLAFGYFQIENLGSALGRNVVLAFPNLPPQVSLANASGFMSNGVPYVNLVNAIESGGLSSQARSAPMLIQWNNPFNIPFNYTPSVFVGATNTSPDFETIPPIEVFPGDQIQVPLIASDADGDQVVFALIDDGQAPNVRLLPGGILDVQPLKEHVGTHQIKLSATDGSQLVEQTVTIEVLSDPVQTTRIRGRVLNTDESPISGMLVEIGSVQTLTDSDGTFFLDMGSGPLASNTLRVRGDTYQDGTIYPFIAEKLDLLFDRSTFQTGVQNVLRRPIYLPILNPGSSVDPQVDTQISQILRSNEPPATVYVNAGSLFTQQGTPFTGLLSITEVPPDRTPAVLPRSLSPGLVVSIQPGEMVFAVPTALTLPNREGWKPASFVDLWSIDPVTGQFQKVGVGQVDASGTQINTISGGIRNSSWHMFVPPEISLEIIVDDACEDCEPSNGGGQPCDLLSSIIGSANNSSPSIPKPNDLAVVKPATNKTKEDSDGINFCQGPQVSAANGNLTLPIPLFAYRSKGQVVGGTVLYDSGRVMTNPVVGIRANNVAVNGANAMALSAEVSRGSTSWLSSGTGDAEKSFWSVGPSQSQVVAGIALPLQGLPSGTYDVQLQANVGRIGEVANSVVGANSTIRTQVPVVNQLASVFGAGWGFVGLEEIIANPDGSYC